jgi:RHS repeat-associated protein
VVCPALGYRWNWRSIRATPRTGFATACRDTRYGYGVKQARVYVYDAVANLRTPACAYDGLNGPLSRTPDASPPETPQCFGKRPTVTNASSTTEFTGKERDAETGLDWFKNRYFSGAQGRFTSPDPFNVIDLTKSKDTVDKFHNYLSNPQHWNHYAYVLNNPLRYTDPRGLLEYDTTLLDKKIHVYIDDSLSDKRQNELKGKLDSAISNINSNGDKLTKTQVGVLGNLKSIDVDSSAKRSSASKARARSRSRRITSINPAHLGWDQQLATMPSTCRSSRKVASQIAEVSRLSRKPSDFSWTSV